jgi:hypothetical protein
MKKYIILLILFINCFKFNIQAQNNPRLHFLIGANISNPHQLFEGAINVYGSRSLKPFGNVYGALIYKNKYQLSLGNELNEYSDLSNFNTDLFLNFRYYFLKDSAIFKPYIETGLVLKTYGESPYIVKNQQSYHFNLGFVYKLSPLVNFDFGISQQFRKMELYDVATWSDDEITLTIDRFMIRTGLIFKVL